MVHPLSAFVLSGVDDVEAAWGRVSTSWLPWRRRRMEREAIEYLVELEADLGIVNQIP